MKEKELINEILNEIIEMNKNGFTMWFSFSGHVDNFRFTGYKGEYVPRKNMDFCEESDLGNTESFERALNKLKKFKLEIIGEDIACKECGKTIMKGSEFKFCPFCAAKLNELENEEDFNIERKKNNG